MIKGRIERVTGPVVVAEGMLGARMWDVVEIGKGKLLGEIIKLVGERAFIEVYEDTNGLEIKEPVVSLGKPFTVELGPGLMGSIYDGLGRPLERIKKELGSFIRKGIRLTTLDRKRKWKFEPKVRKGEEVSGGSVLGSVREGSIVHKIMVPDGTEGKVKSVRKGEFSIEESVCELNNGKRVKMLQEWEVRRTRPYRSKVGLSEPLITGQRVIDSLFPVGKGGNVCVPGGFGSGKTVLESAITKNCDSDINIVCRTGERGNEVTDIINELNESKDRKGRPLMEKSILIVNTSNMPVVARETSIYTAITIGEYFRDQGYNSIVLIDSTSRWAEALREVSGRLEELPGEEGYPVYMESYVGEYHERSGRVENMNGSFGSLTLISSVSPPGADFSEPVTQAVLRATKVFWGLDQKLAWRRHFPAMNWLISYSRHLDDMLPWFKKNVSKDWDVVTKNLRAILQKEAELERVVRVVGIGVLPEKEKFILEIARIVREDFLQQDAFHTEDSYTPLDKQYALMRDVVKLYEKGLKEIESGKTTDQILTKSVKERMARVKYD
ncbi:MAG: V-type ATP synthase subunit A [Candidatus Aenigmarchaeota archaeon]|nr:V-type ATP synthase subunit A [Candidatus Aenigmarchaeota archaeon]NIP39969.1 V-type ATP synthase subunit A [Candidatus Aenigmarchaeota archaeon]NIQ17688.1 V-type ATP synthase subunit A [Candidatus Aenigmarchaeota archaeon]NIS72876.1 V-type ATP synthase subunit A [Candidatus Aenigmarchaeota archaeon]